ncbi:MAG: peptidyl-prolyl cis-trans isomerase [Elusimicrobia bacterium]|nr:peptidyl-prolyl cis-trans isomerase [Elusimicrobiota bacterium]
MKQILKEPLLHFSVLGAGLFVAFLLVRPADGVGAPEKIIITQGQQASMVENFTLTRQRAPTPEEWAGLIRARVREEVYYREALALGLDKDDLIIRRRLQQKMEFISEDNAALADPDDAELNAFLQAHPELFPVEQRTSFRHVYLNPQKRGARLARDAEKLLARLNQAGATADLLAVGDPLMLPPSFDALKTGEIESQFGHPFAVALGELPLARWRGPLESVYGSHLVFVIARQEGRPSALAEIRDAVRREWESVRRREANEEFYQDILKRYSVTVEPSPAEKKEEWDPAK